MPGSGDGFGPGFADGRDDGPDDGLGKGLGKGRGDGRGDDDGHGHGDGDGQGNGLGEVVGSRAEAHRAALTGYCYRMLGSPGEAEDAVQETFERAFRHRERFDEARGTLRAWLFRIATNICLDMLRGARRRAIAIDMGPAASGPPSAPPLGEEHWVRPAPDARVLDPADVAVRRESVRLAFVAALQWLPPRQRAVLILRDVLCWRAAEVADLLGVSAAAVNSALQRARATLARVDVPPADVHDPDDPAQRDLLARYVDAFERYDVAALVALLREDATMSMPPFAWWLQGAEAIRTALLHSDGTCQGARLVPVAANATAAFGQYHPSPGGGHEPFALVQIETRGGRISALTTHLDAVPLFPLFGLPVRLPR
ncbi:sigma-70 family RNA polymerase sigma factor [Bailinhaonella thermotolerans]|uniref:Sigma-70 family RNA polymerase sigma factor n=1 Tax=Bailinhaonella thermotolerans TaxID=1070861 RepID=A0A3A4BQF6_9ACTN|nr:sigma-70 family RNA polymerase sigma factor [Bailinhaonella thermotolerans]RJL33376.1 sigma-70 family RNA polymerase sigma factor [Bailinhaonella thermotolerans]